MLRFFTPLSIPAVSQRMDVSVNLGKAATHPIQVEIKWGQFPSERNHGHSLQASNRGGLQ
jgi:hypothetical protein